MGATTNISWCDMTLNPWIGCSKVHEGCTNCYAEADMDNRRGRVKWGSNGTRSKTSESYWKQPLKWNREAQFALEYWQQNGDAKKGDPPSRPRVFCASLADVFEDWQGPIVDHNGRQLWLDAAFDCYFSEQRTDDVVPATMDDLRRDLFTLIDQTPHLDWLLLTKRPENVRRMWEPPPWALDTIKSLGAASYDRHNVWIGTSVSNQATADKQIPELLKCHDLCPVLFLSCEPLLGPIKLDLLNLETGHPAQCTCGHGHGFTRCPNTGGVATTCHYAHCSCTGFRRKPESWKGIDWVIVGGESGPHARPMHPDWARSIRDQCQAAGVPYFFKQWGEYLPGDPTPDTPTHKVHPYPINTEPLHMLRVGKKAAGHLLDGKVHQEFPVSSQAH